MIWLIARREIAARVQQRGFRIGVLVLLVLIGLGVSLPAAFRSNSPTSYDVALVGAKSDQFASALAGAPVTLHRLDAGESSVRSQVDAGKWDAAVVDGSRVLVQNATSPVVGLIERAYQTVTVQDRLASAGLSRQQVTRALSVQPLPVTATRSAEAGQRQAVATIAVVLLFGQLITYCTWVATGVIEEKSSRVVELLLSAVRPVQLLAGKLVGIGAVAVGQVALLAAVAVGAARAAGTLTVGGPAYVATAIAFAGFVLGFLFFAALAAAAASTVSRQEDLNGVLLPVTGLLMICYGLSFAVTANGTSPYARVISMVPPVSAIAMPARIARESVPGYQIAIAIVLLLLLASGTLLLAARIYRAAVLHTGTRVPLRRAWRGEAVGAV